MANMMLGGGGAQSQEKPVLTMVDVVKQATENIAGVKLKDSEEDIMVMDTKLKIIEILQVS